MPTSPKGVRRPADVIGNAVRVMREAPAAKRGPYTPRQPMSPQAVR